MSTLEMLPLDDDAPDLDELDDASQERIARLTPDEWYRQGVGTLLDGVVWEAMKHQKKVALRIRHAFMLRHVRALDEHARVHPMEAYPKALTVYDIYERAQKSWPEELCDTVLIDRAWRRLEFFHLIAENGVRLKDAPSGKKRWARGYKALEFQPTGAKRTAPDRDALSRRVTDTLMSVAEADQENPPHITTLLYILRRADVPAYIDELRRLRERERTFEVDEGEVASPQAAESVLCIQVAVDPLKAINCI